MGGSLLPRYGTYPSAFGLKQRRTSRQRVVLNPSPQTWARKHGPMSSLH
jgi:hypothetical protein